jgi:adenylate cyclase
MRRPDKAGGKAAKTQRRKTLKRRNAPKTVRRRSSLATGEETNVEQLTRELAEAREREAATAEVLKVISATPGELEPVFQTMLENATRICEATFGTMLLVEATHFGVLHSITRRRCLQTFIVRCRSFNLKKSPTLEITSRRNG